MIFFTLFQLRHENLNICSFLWKQAPLSTVLIISLFPCRFVLYSFDPIQRQLSKFSFMLIIYYWSTRLASFKRWCDTRIWKSHAFSTTTLFFWCCSIYTDLIFFIAVHWFICLNAVNLLIHLFFSLQFISRLNSFFAADSHQFT